MIIGCKQKPLKESYDDFAVIFIFLKHFSYFGPVFNQYLEKLSSLGPIMLHKLYISMAIGHDV